MLTINKQQVQNALATRANWLNNIIDPRRDLDKECGYPSTIDIQMYAKLFERGDVAQRVVTLFPKECWSVRPEVFEDEDPEETDFEAAWKAEVLKHAIFSELHRADVLSGIGRFGIILLGLDDGADLSQPVKGIHDNGTVDEGLDYKLLFIRPFDESKVKVATIQRNILNPRFGQPDTYTIIFDDGGESSIASSPVASPSGLFSEPASGISTAAVHWSRVIHIADNRTNSKIYGIPRMKPVFNRLCDLQKVVGGSGEMFWKGGFPGFALETIANTGEETLELDEEATQEQMEQYMNGLQRYIAIMGMNVKSLAPQVADPTAHMECQTRLIAMTLAVPWRILMGVEVGQLAGEQDIRVWNRRLFERQNDYISPFIIRPFVQRLIDYGVLPKPTDEFHIEWGDLNTPSDKDRADVADKETTACTKYIQGGVQELIPPYYFLTTILGKTAEEADAILDAAMAEKDNPDPLLTPIPVAVPGAPAGPKGIGSTSAPGAGAPAKAPTTN